MDAVGWFDNPADLRLIDQIFWKLFYQCNIGTRLCVTSYEKYVSSAVTRIANKQLTSTKLALEVNNILTLQLLRSRRCKIKSPAGIEFAPLVWAQCSRPVQLLWGWCGSAGDRGHNHDQGPIGGHQGPSDVDSDVASELGARRRAANRT